jgi:hypothetical protein
VTDSEIIDLLTMNGLSPDDWFIMQGSTPAHRSELGVYEALLIEGDRRMAAVVAILRRRGAREFGSSEELVQAGLANAKWL